MSLEKLRLHRPDIYRDTAAAHADECKTLVQLLRLRALRQPHQRSHIFLSDGEREAASLTYAELDRRARAVAAGLQSVGAAGERVLLLYQPGLEYVAAFLGCLYAGAVAVPAYPPRANRGAERLRAVASDARAFAALTTADIRARADSLIRRTPELQRLHWLATDEWADALADDWREPALGGNTLAFLQYTSGSTATPKGVMVSHKNLLANESMIRQVFRQTEQSFVVGWLPLYHDMGLIGNVLQPLYLGVSCALMSPLAFLQRPVRWLRAIAHYRATTSGGPNFAYELCIAKVRPEEREGLDLSTWRVAFNGAEPVRAATLERFAAAFAANGFRRAAFQPCYGLAEATLLVSGSRAGGDPVVKHVSAKELEQHRVAAVVPSDAGARSLVSCGGAATGQRVAVVDPETHDTCSPGEVGEIWVSGPNVAQGYWGREEETERVFRARRADAGDGPFLRTGDLGFVAGGELFVTGRLKDLIIVRGLNYYPHDIEAAAERAHGQFRAGANAAFSATFGDEEQLVVVQEVELRPSRDWPAMAEAIRETVAQEFELQAHAVVLVKPGNVLKTSSGKVQRSLCRSRFCAGELDAVYEWRLGAQPPNARTSDEPARVEAGRVAVWLAEEIAARRGLGVEQIDVDVPLARYGLDSLGAVELAHRLEAATGVRLPMVNFLQDASVAELAAEVERLLAESSAEGDVIEEGGAEGSAQPLSPGQQAIWFLQQLEPDGAAYNIARALRLNADVDAPALGRAFQRLLERHEVLRATFHGTEGDPFMRVHEAAEVSFETADATSWGEPELASRLCEEAHAPFDLSRGPLLRARLFTRGERERVLLLVVHHIVADFWSLSVMLRELGLLYEAEREGTSAGLPPLQTRYADFTRWQRRRLSGAEGERLWAYWQGRLGGEPPVLNLPADRPRPPRQSYKGRAHNFRLGAELTRQLRALSRENGATLYMTLLAGFQVLLHRHTGQDDIWVGSPSAGRTSAKFAPLVGYFVNPLVMRGDLSGQPTFVALLARVRRAALEAFEHQDYPFPLLVERLQPARDPSRSPLFQAMFVLHNMQGGDTRLSALALGRPGVRVTHGGLTFEALPLEQQVAQFDLTLSLAEVDDELAGAFEYNTELFDAETVERMAGHLRRLLEEVTAAPNLPVSHYEMLTPAEHRRLLTEWNGEKTDWPRTATIHSLFEAQVARTPSALAVVAGSRRLTYAELDARASHLAARLRALGVGPEARVGLCLERNAELVVALLAVLKAGGAYVPLDPNYPAERLAFMLEDSGARVVLTHSSLLNRLPETGARRLCLDADADADNAQKSEVLPVSLPLSSTSLAYLIYTSGSTGRPKGVAIEHRNAVAMLDWALRLFGVERLSRVLASTSVCFDLSVFEIFSPLSCGGAVVLADSALELPSLEAAGEVTLINTVPSAMAELARLGALPRSARTVNLAGEPLKGALARAVYAHESVDELYNLYGPSEDTTYSTWALVRRGAAREPVIGRPVSNSQAYVLDERLRPVPVGVAGELYLGGAGVARGYLGRPDLTAERFIPDPLSGEAGGRLYRTGDVARRLAGGELDFLGRGDGQVKVRGFRVELGEVEAALLRHESVREATVVARDGGGEDKRLVGYVVPANAGDFSLTALQNYLREKLPAFMIPTAWVVLEALPLTPNGKIDRRALPEPTSAASGEEYVAPRTALEELVVGVWAEVLGVERVGVGDNFFDLGGHSLLAAQVVARLRRACAVDLPLRSIFETPTPAQLADALAGLLRSESGVQAPPVERVERVGPLPLSFGQERLWFLEQLEPDSLAYNMSAAARLEGPLDVGALERSLNEIVRRHEVLRTSFVSNDDRPQQICESELTLRLNVEHVLGRDEQERQEAVQRIAGEEARHRFDLTKAPLLKVRLLRLGARTHVLLLTTHHIVWDGWSTAIFVRELAALYEAFSVGGPSPLAELPVQYADYAVWQRGWLRGERLREQVEYWRGRLAGAPPVLELPTDRPRPAVQTFRGGRHAVEVPEELSARLRQLGRDEGATLFMTLLAGFAAFLHRYTGEEAVVVGTPVANRSRVEFENLIGFFVNTLPLRVDVDGGLSFRELLAGVRSAALTAYAHQDVPFEQLVAELQPERSLGHAPLFQVMLTLENEPAEAASFGGLKLSRQQSSTGTAKFDLAFFVKETARGLEGELEFNADLFDSVTGARMAGHLLKLLASAAADPGQKVSDLPLVEEEEERVLLAESKGEETDWPRTATIHSLFEAQAAETPSALAVVADDEQLSYAELDRRATRLAHRLRALGVGPEVRVGLCLGHTPRLVEAILGVLKAGGAYVPLDPEYPRERLAFMLKDSEAPVVLTESSLAAGLPESGALQLCLDADAGEEGGELAPLPPVAPSSLAYVIYTSGSTGRPKGVQIEHAALVNYVWWARGAYLRGERLDFALYSSIAFDLTVTSVYVPLVSGACVHVYRKAGGHSALEAALEGDRAEALKLTPSHLALLAARDNRGSRLRRLVVGGEALTTELARAVQRSFGREVEIYNEYGPTEATVGCMIHRFGAGADDRVHVPIGRPAANARVYVLDERLRPVPVGVAGELYLGGAGVARGYLGRPDLTAERFIPDPLSGEAGGRLYRTGDVARRLAGGELDFLGRGDGQVKVRGFRVELGEVEAALLRHESVREATVVARGQAGADVRLAAYVTLEPDAEGGRERPGDEVEAAPESNLSRLLKRYLSERLPDYMIPSWVCVLEALPLTPNGKIDRRALPEPTSAAEAGAAEYVAPRDETETRIAAVWAEVLGVERVGVNDNFFDLGGHSLLATQVVARLRREFNITLPLRSLFESPDVAGLALAVAQAAGAQAEKELPEVAAAGRGGKSLEQLLAELQRLSADEVNRMLEEKKQRQGGDA